MGRDRIKAVFYDYAMDNLKYVMLCARSDIGFVVRIMNEY